MTFEPTAWVVYRMAPFGGAAGRNAVCSQAEWEALDEAVPGRHTLIRGHIGNEGEAERLARDLQTPPAAHKPPRRAAARVGPPALAGSGRPLTKW